MDLSAYIQQAYDGGAYSYLLEMLRSESFQESDVSYELLWMVEDLPWFYLRTLSILKKCPVYDGVSEPTNMIFRHASRNIKYLLSSFNFCIGLLLWLIVAQTFSYQNLSITVFCCAHGGSFVFFQVQVGGYKSVVKTLTAAFLAAYDSATQVCCSV